MKYREIHVPGIWGFWGQYRNAAGLQFKLLKAHNAVLCRQCTFRADGEAVVTPEPKLKRCFSKTPEEKAAVTSPTDGKGKGGKGKKGAAVAALLAIKGKLGKSKGKGTGSKGAKAGDHEAEGGETRTGKEPEPTKPEKTKKTNAKEGTGEEDGKKRKKAEEAEDDETTKEDKRRKESKKEKKKRDEDQEQEKEKDDDEKDAKKEKSKKKKKKKDKEDDDHDREENADATGKEKKRKDPRNEDKTDSKKKKDRQAEAPESHYPECPVERRALKAQPLTDKARQKQTQTRLDDLSAIVKTPRQCPAATARCPAPPMQTKQVYITDVFTKQAEESKEGGQERKDRNAAKEKSMAAANKAQQFAPADTAVEGWNVSTFLNVRLNIF